MENVELSLKYDEVGKDNLAYIYVPFNADLKMLALCEFNKIRNKFAMGKMRGFNSASRMLTLVTVFTIF